MGSPELISQPVPEKLEAKELEAGYFDGLGNPDEATVFLKRHGDYKRSYPKSYPPPKDFDAETAGALTPEGKEEAKRYYKELFRNILNGIPEDLPIDVLVVHSPTKWLDWFKERATESADIVLEAAHEIFDGSNRDTKILNDLDVRYRKGQLAEVVPASSLERNSNPAQDPKLAATEKRIFADRKMMITDNQFIGDSRGKEKIPISRLREANIHFPVAGLSEDQIIDRFAFINALRQIHGKDFWKPYVEDRFGKLYGEKDIDDLNEEELSVIQKIFGLSSLTKEQLKSMGDPRDLEKIRELVGAESPKDIANRITVVLRGASMLHSKLEREAQSEAEKKGETYQKRKLVVVGISHGDVIESFMKQGALATQGNDYTAFGYNQGIRIDLDDRRGKVKGPSGNEYMIDLKK